MDESYGTRISGGPEYERSVSAEFDRAATCLLQLIAVDHVSAGALRVSGVHPAGWVVRRGGESVADLIRGEKLAAPPL
jgi:hypothetical protein